ncbi:inactive tyrosine-protein kinase PEAK1 isoform X1 [Stegostoma tigrinum]|uniref:inactive tyrosine-protein kinase PEAK1 isoform X1 n=1 Tax=Stegostoma tigrinum TaxID=3053191 RepID=UPI0028705EE7|nr:inactive tyrosine-protein kinase PEAK1 isoform X1 [Stegostoma tigrinum]XP_048376793.2 inactive tyrosine-protein kinase PEAK1 isoform X1 [Stegostoma tigrinum]XP_048376794.2 inactive tyrosine-protein kinase PEAK1 isoform X1 [Stegostoma tigrinum]XP_048376795.2 inactive tyrosine-protein kinase PEAK1 isoform X1 [Stegostoma tigrinum]XP_048376797.2 inactive tyrosine-protein kinase PEAK1 isoform X1 [Stegostoma tigrinum]XP_059496200.1 inactive tyrosine-protein kinase PEAK1 isoform X1 [Stegostoma tig
MSACNTFTEHVWKPGECKNCFKPKSLHCLSAATETPPLSHKNLKTNANHSNNHRGRSGTGNFRPPVAKKPTIAVKPTMMVMDGQTVSTEMEVLESCENKQRWNRNGVLLNRKPVNNNNNEENNSNTQRACKPDRGFNNRIPNNNNNGLTDVLKEIVEFEPEPHLQSKECDRESFLGRINKCYQRSLERKLPPSCIVAGMKENAGKHVMLSSSSDIISNEGGLFCYPDCSFNSDQGVDNEPSENATEERESWDESDEELLAMEIRMRGQPRFANFRANTLSPVRFRGDKKWNTVPLRKQSLQRICAVDYDDSYDEILNGYGDETLIPYGQDSMPSILSSESPSPDSSMTEGSQTGTTKTIHQQLCNGDLSSSDCKSTKFIEPDYESISENGQISQVKQAPFKPARGTAAKSLETHKAVLALRLEEKDGKIALQSEKQEFTMNSTECSGQTVTINIIPKEEQAKPYRVVDLEPPGMCKPYTVVDVSASMNNKKTDSSSESLQSAKTSPVSANPPTSLSSQISNQKKSSITRYQEVWTSSTSPRQKMPRVALMSSSSGPTPPPRHMSHKSAPTSPTTSNVTSKTIPVKSPNLSEIKFNSYNNAGMPPFPIIIHDEPTYAQSSKHKAIKVPIVINPNAYDNLAIYKSFLGPSGSHLKKESLENVASHTYEEIGSTVRKSTDVPQVKGPGCSTERKVFGSVAQKVQEFNNAQNKAQILSQSSPHKNFGSNHSSPSRIQRATQDSPARREETPERQTSSASRENASTVLSQIVASIQPPQLPPENPQTQSKASSAEELYSQPPAISEGNGDVHVRPKSLFSPEANSETEVSKVMDNTLAKGQKESILTKQVTVPTSKPSTVQFPGATSLSPKSEQLPPFPPPRSTSSPYHASNLLHKHFSNWGKPTSPVRTPEIESAPLNPEGRQRLQEAKPKRWISFKSFFRRRKTDEEEEKEKDKDKLIGLNGRVIHMLPPPPIQRHHLCSDQKMLEPSEKLTAILSYKQELGLDGVKTDADKLDVVGIDTETHSTGSEAHGMVSGLQDNEKPAMDVSESEKETVSSQNSPPPPPPKKCNNLPGEVTVEDMPPQVSEVQRSASTNQETPGTMTLMLVNAGSQDDKDAGSESTDESISSATYSNLAKSQSWRAVDGSSETPGTTALLRAAGQSRANMIPLKQPRQVKGASDDAIAFVGSTEQETMSDSQPTPPPLPKKTIIRANTDPTSKDHAQKKIDGRNSGHNVNLANPLYDIEYPGDANWDASSACSSLSSDARLCDNESGDSLERAVSKSMTKARASSTVNSTCSLTMSSCKEGYSNSLDSLSEKNRIPQRPGKSIQKPQRHTLYKGIENKEEVIMKIRNLHTESLRKLAGKCEDRFMEGQKNQLRFGLDNWSDFRLTSDKPCCEAGDAVYYTASYAKDLHNQYAIKICKSQAKASQQLYYHSLAVRQSLAVHFNIQQDCGHFLAEVPVRMLPWEDPNTPVLEEEENEGSSDVSSAIKSNNPTCKGTSSKHRSRVVVITREVPYQTVADFVRESAPRHTRNPEIYERQVCLLLLQLCAGLNHLKPHHVTHCDLRLENLLLVRCRQGTSGNCESENTNPNAQLARLIVSNFSQAKQKSQVIDLEALKDQSRLAPEIITITQYKKCDEFQTGILIYEMLHLPNPFEENPELKEKEYTRTDLPAIPNRSVYSQGLQQLASLLLHPNPSERILISDAKVYLQCLLWGPRDDLLQTLNSLNSTVERNNVLQSWLDLKRTLLMIKFAEKAIDIECSVSLEVWLCCQYLAFASVESLSHIVKLLQLQ